MCNKRIRGLTLIELLIFIVIIGIAANAMLAVFFGLTRSSAGVIPEKQAQAIASSMMNEILAQPFTFCDPNAPNASTATNVAACGAFAEFINPEGEFRGGSPPFDNVNDYNGYSGAASFPDNSAIAGLAGYNVQVSIASAGVISGVPAAETLRVTVTVTPPSGPAVQLDGVRIRYAPNT